MKGYTSDEIMQRSYCVHPSLSFKSVSSGLKSPCPCSEWAWPVTHLAKIEIKVDWRIFLLFFFCVEFTA